jgi:hypothetical protein
MADDLMDLDDGRYELLLPTDLEMSLEKEQCAGFSNTAPAPVPDPAVVQGIHSVELSSMTMGIGGCTATLDNVAISN